MEREEFDRRVEKYDRQIQASPGLYKAKVLVFALIGYVAYALMILATLGVLVGIVAVVVWYPQAWVIKLGFKALLPVGVLILAMVAALKVGGYIPTGIALTEAQAPLLYREIDAIRRKLRVPELSRVFLTDDYNASVVQNPRFGFFGTQNILLLGMPLLQSLSPQDVRVVLAHEFGHLSGNHSRFSGWVYRAVGTYARLLESTGGSAVIEKFLNWYVPRLDALSFPLRRQNEYEADAAAAEINGNERAAQALANVETRAHLLSDFWKGVFRRVVATPHPPAQLFRDWADGVPRLDPKTAEQALQEGLEAETGTDDTHPSLKDRVAALGAEVRVEPWTGPSAAEEFFGDRYDDLVEQAGYLWCSAVQESWKAKYGELSHKRERLASLEDERQKRTLNADEAFEYADLFEDVCPDQDALPYFQAALELHPDHEATRFAVGRLLCERDDPQGQPFLEGFSSHADPNYRMASAALLSGFHRRNNDENAAEKVLEWGRRAAQEQEERDRDHDELRLSDSFVAHGLSQEKLDQVALKLALIQEIKTAYLVQKVIAHAEQPTYVIAFTSRSEFFSEDDPDEKAVLKLQASIDFLGECWFLPLSSNGKFRSKFEAIAGSEIYTV